MHHRNKKPTVVILVVVLLIFFSWLGFLDKPYQWFNGFLGPLERFFYKSGLSLISFKNYQLLNEENQKLRTEIAKLSLDYVKFSNLESENLYLRGELDFLKSKGYDYELVNVVASQPFNDKILIIDKGSNSGLAVGQAAAVHQGIIVGKVIKVEADRAWVELLNDTASQLAVSLGQSIGTNGLLVGRAGNSLVIDFIPQDKDLKVGDLVITSGLEEKIPRGLSVGSISHVASVVGEVFKQARVEPIINYESLQNFTIIK
ncbi:MAG TPA: rod shape-determining protein MreC [Patescibacteria group bacterium]|nr:rod shape-determining protein MreC [Patescibacteria group bacterium]